MTGAAAIRRLIMLVGLAVAVGAMAASPARAQGNCTASTGSKCTTITVAMPNSSSITNPRVVSLGATPATATWNITQASLNLGHSDAVAVTLTVSANRPWTLSVHGGTWVVGGAAWTAKPIGHARWALNNTTFPGTSLTTSPAVVATGSAGTQTVTIWFNTQVAWTTDTPGSYQMPLTFTLASP